MIPDNVIAALEIYKNLKDRDLQKENVFMGEGRYIVERMIKANCKIISIVCTPENSHYFDELSKNKFPVIEKTRQELVRITGFRFHRGVLAAARRPFMPDLKRFLADSPLAPALVVLPFLSEAENMGSIIRSAAAFSFNGVITGPGSVDPLSRKALRCSMGTVFEIPLSTYTDHQAAISIFREHGYHIIGTTPSVSGKPLRGFHFPEKCVFVFGHESDGLIPPWDSACDTYLRIKISTNLDSLNAGVAAGIFFYEFSNRNG